jgi:hypothetical protein
MLHSILKFNCCYWLCHLSVKQAEIYRNITDIMGIMSIIIWRYISNHGALCWIYKCIFRSLLYDQLPCDKIMLEEPALLAINCTWYIHKNFGWKLYSWLLLGQDDTAIMFYISIYISNEIILDLEAKDIFVTPYTRLHKTAKIYSSCRLYFLQMPTYWPTNSQCIFLNSVALSPEVNYTDWATAKLINSECTRGG